MAQINLAPNFYDLWPSGARQTLGDVGNGPQILGDVFAHPAIAPGRALNQDTFFITN